MASTEETIVVAVNRADGDKSADGVPSGAYEDLLTGETVNGPNPSVKARSARVLLAK